MTKVSMDQYAVVGNPISQSKSPKIHSEFAKQTGQRLTYSTIEVPAGAFVKTIEAFRAAGARGINITAPCKLDAYSYATDLTDQARAAGAINCIKFADGKIYGQNFDGTGLVRDITNNVKSPIAGKRVLLLGAGGAARGALLPLLDQKPAQLIICNRSEENAVAVASLAPAGSPVGICDYDSLLATGHFDIVLNATSVALHGLSLKLPTVIFTPVTLAYEMSYGKGKTDFLKQAEAAGAGHLADGVGMLVEQAAQAFEWWRGVRPNTASVIEMLRVPLV
jgi:shikimate dehydrogenase